MDDEDDVVVDIIGDDEDEARPSTETLPLFKRQRLWSNAPSAVASAGTAADGSFDADTSPATAMERSRSISRTASAAPDYQLGERAMSAQSFPVLPPHAFVEECAAVAAATALLADAELASDQLQGSSRRPCGTVGCLSHDNHAGPHTYAELDGPREVRVPRWLLALAH
mmetsp:Transcript_7890/g.20208  ORF Transcript_7890/g.20208 Transcript_7890/m.20208 type:complete len:169 (+) Transcript_7890:687-1193(+)